MPPIDSPTNANVFDTGEQNFSTVTLSGLPVASMNTQMRNMALDSSFEEENNNPLDPSARQASIYNCFPFMPPSLSSLFSFARKETALTHDPANQNDDFAISLESIAVNFKEDYIGGGNQSSVFRGIWNGRAVALKKLNRATDVDIKKLKSLEHPNVIATLGMCSKDIYPIIVMEFCEKGGLFDVLRREHISKLLFTRWTREIAEGMSYLHSLKIVHRDLKSPNILVNGKDCLKIADFGSLYTGWEKTQMPSVVMSVCGTTQWMSPEMLKTEPCNEKVDVWSFGVVLWELLTQEVPYRNIGPMAIIFGVGSDRLRLHIPRTAADSLKLLLKSCWAKRPRNRPSFASILNHLANLRVEISDMSEDAWSMRKEVWRKEIAEENERLTLHNSNAAELCESAKEDEIIRKRMHELRHAQEIREMYEKKLHRLNLMDTTLFKFLEDIRLHEEELVQRENRVLVEEQRISQRKNRAAHMSAQKHHRPHSVSLNRHKGIQTEASTSGKCNRPSSVKVQAVKTVCDRVDPNVDGCSRMHLDNALYSCVPGGRRAVITMSIDSEENDDDYYQLNGNLNDPNDNGDVADSVETGRHFTQRRVCSSSSEDEPMGECDCHGGKHRQMGRTSSGKLQSNMRTESMERNSPSRMMGRSPKVSISSSRGGSIINLHVSNSDAGEHQPQVPVMPICCPQCQYMLFSRNSLARASGLSADSGICHLDAQSFVDLNLAHQPTSSHANEILMRPGRLEKFGAHSIEAEPTHLIPQQLICLSRDVPERWSEGRVPFRKKTRRPVSQNLSSLIRDARSGQPKRSGSNKECACSTPIRHSYSSASTIPSANKGQHKLLSASSFEENLTSNGMNFPCECIDRECLRSRSTFSIGTPIRERPVDVSDIQSNERPVDVDIEPQFTRKSQIENQRVAALRVDDSVMQASKAASMAKSQSEASERTTMKESRSWPPYKLTELTDKDIRCPKRPAPNECTEEEIEAVAAMLESSSTMISSLERSLEMAVVNSDGLSDKESKLKEAKTLFKTHRRTASNPLSYPMRNTVCETSTESDDPAYC